MKKLSVVPSFLMEETVRAGKRRDMSFNRCPEKEKKEEKGQGPPSIMNEDTPSLVIGWQKEKGMPSISSSAQGVPCPAQPRRSFHMRMPLPLKNLVWRQNILRKFFLFFNIVVFTGRSFLGGLVFSPKSPGGRAETES